MFITKQLIVIWYKYESQAVYMQDLENIWAGMEDKDKKSNKSIRQLKIRLVSKHVQILK